MTTIRLLNERNFSDYERFKNNVLLPKKLSVIINDRIQNIFKLLEDIESKEIESTFVQDYIEQIEGLNFERIQENYTKFDLKHNVEIFNQIIDYGLNEDKQFNSDIKILLLTHFNSIIQSCIYLDNKSTFDHSGYFPVFYENPDYHDKDSAMMRFALAIDSLKNYSLTIDGDTLEYSKNPRYYILKRKRKHRARLEITNRLGEKTILVVTSDDRKK
ncbi:MAG: hypothetical protein JXQ87_05190 [Bacteroidia bacterium]